MLSFYKTKRRGKTTLCFVVFTLVISLALFSFSPEVFADAQDFGSSADAYLQSGSPNVNNGFDATMDLTNTRDGVVRFDISAIPSGSTIASATLTLVATAVGSATAVKNYGAHQILVDWAEGTVTWNTPGSTAGTHFATSPTETIAVSATGSYHWNVTGDVANFVNGSATNYGWRIIWSSNTEGTNKQVDFGTKENATPSNRPVLSVTYTPPGDTTAPAAISNLSASNATTSSIDLSWTSPGDDASSGTATSYDIRYATSTITDGNWSSAVAVSGEPAPLVAGTSQSMTVAGLSAGTTYYFAMKTSDEVPNTSALSNVPSLATTATPDTTAPAAVTNLALSDETASSIKLAWTAPGDDGSSGTATSYDIRYSASAITGANWSGATPASGEPAPQAAGTSQSMTVTGLSPGTTYFFAMKTSDEVPNTSALSNVPSSATLAEAGGPSPAPAPGGGVAWVAPPRQVIFSGYAYPESAIEVLRKSAADESYLQVPSENKEIAGDGSFSISYAGLANADYLFAMRVKDKDGRSSGMLAFNVPLSGDLVEVKNIVAPPTVGFEKTSVAKGEVMKIFGYATPQNMVELNIDGAEYKKTKASQSGFWSVDVDTAYLAYGEHSVRARQITTDAKPSNFSLTRVFKLSKFVVPKADLSGDGVIDIRDWSIFLFRWGNEDSALHLQNDINGDGKVDIFDFSLFLQVLKT